MKTFLHVGCGSKHKGMTNRVFNTPDWLELRLDIDPDVKPDIVSSMLDMPSVANASVDAVYSSHNLEHLYPHEVIAALREFRRVLAADGFLVLTCPDLRSVCSFVANDKLTEALYHARSGEPISPLDVLYGWGARLAEGKLFMAHKCGFTLKTLIASLHSAGFCSVAGKARATAPNFDLWALATVTKADQAHLTRLAEAHFPP